MRPRQGLYGGLLLGAVEMMVLFVSNLALPAAAHQWAGRDPVGFGLLAVYAAAFVLIGARGELRAGTGWAGARAGAAAGFVVAVLFVVTFAILFTVFYPTMIQEPGHLDDTHASLNRMLLRLVFVVPRAGDADSRPTRRSRWHARHGTAPMPPSGHAVESKLMIR